MGKRNVVDACYSFIDESGEQAQASTPCSHEFLLSYQPASSGNNSFMMHLHKTGVNLLAKQTPRMNNIGENKNFL